MEPITDDLSLRKQNMFVVEIWKVKIVHPVNSDWKYRSDCLADMNNLTSRASASPTFHSYFCQGIVLKYDITMPWLVKMPEPLNQQTEIGINSVLGWKKHSIFFFKMLSSSFQIWKGSRQKAEGEVGGRLQWGPSITASCDVTKNINVFVFH